jgi:hypothetical protein
MADNITTLYSRLRPLIRRDFTAGTTIVNNIITPPGGGGGGGGAVDLSWLVPRAFPMGATAPIAITGDFWAANIAYSLNLDSSGGLETSGGNLRAKLQSPSGLDRSSGGLALADSVAGNGLGISSKVLALGTPSTLSHSSTNATTINSHTHSITSSSNPGAAASLLASDASGYLTLVRLTASDRVRAPLIDTASGNLVLDSASGIVQVDDDLLVDQDVAVTRHLQVATDVLRVDATNKAIGVNVTPDGAAALDIRAGTTSDHSQRIKQISGQTGRLWRVESTSGQELIVLDSVGNLQSGNPGFVSGLTGWRITPTGDAEFNDGKFRGELHATVFVFDEVNVQNGTNLITPHGGKLELDVTLSATPINVNRNVETTAFVDQDYLNVETTAFVDQNYLDSQIVENRLHVSNPNTGHYKLFLIGEVLRMKVWTGSAITDTWLKVNSARDEGTHWSYAVTVVSGSLPHTYAAGAAVAGYGEPGDGAIRISADDAYGPLIDIFTTGAVPWVADLYPHVRLGRLDGVGVPGVSGVKQWGMVAGANLADANSPYMVMSNIQQYMYKVKSEWHDGTNITARIEPHGRARFGTNVDNPLTTFLDIDPVSQLATFRGAIEVLSGTIPSGVVSGLGALATQNDLDGVPNGSTYSRVNSTIINGGNIRVGTGVKDSTLNGISIDATEIVQQTGGIDGVVFDALGISATLSNAWANFRGYQFKDAGTTTGGLWGYASADSIYMGTISGSDPYGGGANYEVASHTIGAVSGGLSKGSFPFASATMNASVVGASGTNGLVSIERTQTASTATIMATDIYLDGKSHANNILNVESTAW